MSRGDMRMAAFLLVLGLTAAACGGDSEDEPVDPGADVAATTAAGGASGDQEDTPLLERVCELLTPDEVERFASAAAVDSGGVYDGFLAPVADVCRFDGAFTLQLDYGFDGDALVAEYLVGGDTQTAAISANGFEGMLEFAPPDPDLGTDGFVNQVLVQVGDWVLILNPDDLIAPDGSEAGILEELAGIAAGRV